MRFVLLLPALCLCAFWGLSAQAPAAKPHKVILHILKANVDGELVATAKNPAFGFHVEAGQERIADDSFMECVQTEEMRTTGGVRVPVVVATCGEVRMTISGVDLGD